MRAGVCTYWFNRGQGTIGRYLRGILEDLGVESHVLARPTREKFVRPGHVDRTGIWDQPRITALSSYDAGPDEYLAWAEATGVDVVLFFQHYDFDSVRALRRQGVRTVGCFMWESFEREHVPLAQDAYDAVYSLTRAGRDFFRSMGLDALYVPFGCHPELAAVELPPRDDERCSFLYAGGYLSGRKPTGAVLQAFRSLRRPDVRLVVKAQRNLRAGDLVRPSSQEDVARRHREAAQWDVDVEDDDRIEIITDDLGTSDYYRLLAGADVCIGVARWEGLGLHLYEAIGLGRPVIATDMPPVDEVVENGESGLLVDSVVIGHRKNGIPSREPSVEGLAAAMEVLADPGRRRTLAAGASARARELDWSHTVDGYRRILEQL